jgi:electron transport complex protein RnfE
MSEAGNQANSEAAMETPSAAPWKDIAWNGVWKQNTGVVQILGLCPILAVSNTFVNAVSLGLATILVMALSNVVISALRNLIPYEIRIPVFILIIAALVTVVELAMNAWLHSLFLVLGIFIPLIVTNCIVLARIEAFSAKNPLAESTLDGAAMGFGLTLVLAILGAMREIAGTGQIFGGIEMVIPGAHAVQVLPADYPGFLAAILPPGAFIFLGLLIAGKNWLEARAAARIAPGPAAAAH